LAGAHSKRTDPKKERRAEFSEYDS
jgi:hypothetical protein